AFLFTKQLQLVKTDENATAAILKQAADILLNLALLMEPFMPEASQRLLNQLGITHKESEQSPNAG
ncbi:MAG: hypothetical protein EBZ18_06955, partial [Alphaproteobacteria bacterium]|nr:hypothetical protein [Alphaproteobacteria bacterium]